MILKKNDIFEAEIIDYTSEGSGICRIEGIAVFVPDTAVGDRAEIRIVKTAKNYAFGRLEKIISPSAERCQPDCGIFRKCGGCTFRHISYDAELDFKQKRVTDALTRIGGVKKDLITGIVGSDKISGYRNKAQLPLCNDPDGRIRAGFFAPRSHRVIPLTECALQTPVFNRAAEIFLEWANSRSLSVYDEREHKGVLRHLYLRSAEKTGELMVCVVANADSLPGEDELVGMLRESLPGLKTVVLNINKDKTNVIVGKKCRSLWGEGYITDELCGHSFRISPLSFYQVNRDQAERLYGIAGELAGISKHETLIDMYCGTGTIGLSMASKVKKLIGVEIIPQAVEDAKKNAAANGITNAEFICADAAVAAAQLRADEIKADCIVLDPPRKGCSAELIETVVSMSPKRIVYVSCDPATLARDISIFTKHDYNVQKAVPVDMFPRTAHVETVCLLSKLFSQGSTAVEFDLENIPTTKAEAKATYDQIKAYVLETTGLNVSTLYISQVKHKHGIIERENYNLGSGKAPVPTVPPEKEAAIEEALRHFQMI